MHLLSNFQIIRPRFESTQESILEWILAAHEKAESVKTNGKPFDSGSLKALLQKVGCKPKIIEKRGHEIPDFLHQNWNEMAVYKLDQFPNGAGPEVRQQVYSICTDSIFQRFYSDQALPPEDIIHVSCTGYAGPSSAQRLVSERQWGSKTRVTHAYHMGCYGAIPAIRIASAFGTLSDIVHTELCSLHMNPLLHEADQLLSQTLFADGYIKYSMLYKKEPENPTIRLLITHEKIIPDSSDLMKWHLSDWGFRFGLSKEIPSLVSIHTKDYLNELCERTGSRLPDLLENGLFAIHPGGPKILDNLQKLFGLQDQQLSKSREVLHRYGNISSATLPHIWESICSDPAIPSRTKIISLAFGPGLTIAGALMEKV